MHHIVSDGHAGGIFFQELSAIYAAFAVGQPHSCPKLMEQYAEYAVREPKFDAGGSAGARARLLAFHLKNAPPALDLPTDKPRSEIREMPVMFCSVVVSESTVAGLKSLARSNWRHAIFR